MTRVRTITMKDHHEPDELERQLREQTLHLNVLENLTRDHELYIADLRLRLGVLALRARDATRSLKWHVTRAPDRAFCLSCVNTLEGAQDAAHEAEARLAIRTEDAAEEATEADEATEAMEANDSDGA